MASGYQGEPVQGLEAGIDDELGKEMYDGEKVSHKNGKRESG